MFSHIKRIGSTILFYDSRVLEWILRLLFTYNIVMPGINYESKSYPLSALIILLICFWLYALKFKLISLGFLLYAVFLNYMATLYNSASGW